jgi:quercetin dioxygenase-like cupin family protein/DNA-binding Xre family transcriptional regulator
MADPLPESLGQRLRRLRLDRGQGLREQAREIGMSASSLSALENNRGGVSLQRLQRLAEHYGLQITDLLSDAGETAPPSSNGRLREPEIIRSWGTAVPGVERGTGVVYQLLGPGHGHQLQPYLISFQPGASYRNDAIAHSGEEFAYVLTGAVELILGEQTHRLEQGDSIRFSPEVPHAFRNASANGIAMIVGAATPPW